MVIGKERDNWHTEHGINCTCAECSKAAAENRQLQSITNGRKVGRNEKCPCGSQKKYKRCHGK